MTAAVEAARLRPLALAVPRVRARTLLPAAVYAAGQTVTLAMALLVAHAHHVSLYKSLSSWDGGWFLGIAEHGYRHSVEPGANSVAFFPGYPMLLHGLHVVTGVGVKPLGLAISAAAGVVAAYGLTRLVRDRRVGLVLVALFATAPMSIVLAMTYSEALFCAFAVWALVFIQERRWLPAAALIAAAGLTRQSALALFAALIVAVVLAARSGRADWRAVAALVLAPVGALGYLAWVSYVTLTPAGWFTAERKGWGTRFDFGSKTARFLYHALIYTPTVLAVAIMCLLGAAVVLLGRLCWERRAVLAVYAGVVLASDVMTAGVTQSKVRLLIPAFPLLIPVAEWVARQSPRRQFVLVGALALAGAWYSAFGLITYGHVHAL